MTAEDRTYAESINDVLARSVAAGQPAILALTVAIRDNLRPAFQRVGRSMRRLSFVFRLAQMQANDTRPNGKPRRSGHRHRGTAAWDRRSGVR